MSDTFDTNDTIPEKGNTEPSPTNTRGRRWCLTLNNYSAKEYDTLTQLLLTSKKYILGKEIGEEKTPHLQGYVEFSNARCFNSLKKWNKRMHIEKAAGNCKQNYIYCSKEGDFITNIDPEGFVPVEKRLLKLYYSDITWKDWQQEIIDIIESTPDTRKIYWYWEPTGNVGKSFICKYISMKYDAILCGGKTNDIFNQVNNWRTENPTKLDMPPCILDIPRSDYCHVNYAAIEQLKNGCLYSGKYEGGKIHSAHPHVIIFANSEPDCTGLSLDRFIMRQIKN